MRRLLTILVAVWLVGSIILAACGTPVPALPDPANAGDIDLPDVDVPDVDVPDVDLPAGGGDVADGDGLPSVCEVTDVGGIDDKSFNATAWAGLQRAERDFDLNVAFLESQQQTDYEVNINAFLEEGCDLIVGVGFLMGDAVGAAAEANPDQNFAIIDFAYDPAYDNVAGIVFGIDQAGFLAGYAAAAATQTGTVGTFGGINIPPVTAFMDGYVYGVRYYNDQNGTDVSVLGWDPEAQDGLFTGNFESLDDGRTLGESLMDEGADVIMPVAGPVGLGTAAAIQERGNAWIIGVDTDWTVSASEYADIVLTSVLKRMDSVLYLMGGDIAQGTYVTELFVGTLENEGVGIAPLTNFDGDISADLAAIEAGIIAGDFQTAP